jgi:hypothetical protein
MSGMKNLILLMAGAAAAVAYVVLTKSPRTTNQPVAVTDLAHRLQDAWVDHHTVA